MPNTVSVQNQKTVDSQSESIKINPKNLSASQNRTRKNPSTSSANQTRLLRLMRRQTIRIDYYVTRELSARLEVTSQLSARVGSV